MTKLTSNSTTQSSKTSRTIVWLYAITIGIMLGGSALALWRNWVEQRHVVEQKLVHDASMVSLMIDDDLLDALKLLQITKRDLQEIDYAHANETQLHQLLKQTEVHFGFYGIDEVFGLLFYIDKAGTIRGQSANGPLPHVNVSPRRYFKVLASDPALPFAIGNRVIGLISGTPIFHIAIPLLDGQGQFLGLLAQQIRTDKLTEDVQLAHSQVEGTLKTFLPDGTVAFVYPDTKEKEPSASTDSVDVFLMIKNAAPLHGIVFLEDGDVLSGTLIGYARSEKFGLTTAVMMPMSSVVTAFIDNQKVLLIYIVLGAAVVSLLFYAFYRRTIAYNLVQIQSVHDELTGLHNRRGLDEQLPEMLRQAQRDHQSIGVLFIDIDHFKVFNDTLGHEVGDQVLVKLAGLIRRALQRPFDFVCRWGGEEFVVILPGTDESGAIYVAERILDEVRRMTLDRLGSGIASPTVSIGLTSMAVNASNIHEDLIDQADKAMLEAKMQGRNRLVVYQA